jgi:hypothetical protein
MEDTLILGADNITDDGERVATDEVKLKFAFVFIYNANFLSFQRL